MFFQSIVFFLFLVHVSILLYFLGQPYRRDMGQLQLVGHCFTVVSGLLACILGVSLVFGEQRGFHSGEFNWSVPLFFVFGLGSVILFGLLLWRRIEVRYNFSFSIIFSGLFILTVFAGIYVMFTACDHWWFFYTSHKSQAGTAIADLFGADDVACNSMVIVRLESNLARYRCPAPGAIVWGGHQMKNFPFIPWPDYHEGTSFKLKNGIESVFPFPEVETIPLD